MLARRQRSTVLRQICFIISNMSNTLPYSNLWANTSATKSERPGRSSAAKSKTGRRPGMRLRQQRPGLRLLNFRNGMNIACRGGTRDWDIVHELYFAGSYGRAMQFLKALPGEPAVLDLGGNIGLFSLLAAKTHPSARIYTYEPGPPNYQMFELNCLANPGLSDPHSLVQRRSRCRTDSGVAEWLGSMNRIRAVPVCLAPTESNIRCNSVGFF